MPEEFDEVLQRAKHRPLTDDEVMHLRDMIADYLYKQRVKADRKEGRERRKVWVGWIFSGLMFALGVATLLNNTVFK